MKKQYKYVRIQGREDSRVTKYPRGIFGMCWRLIQDGKMNQEDEWQIAVQVENGKMI